MQNKLSVKQLSDQQLIDAANRIIRGETQDLDYTEALAKRLKNENRTAYAAELYFGLLDRVGNKPVWRKELAVCLYKDPDLPSALKFKEALKQLALTVRLPDEIDNSDIKIMKSLESLETSEYLGVAGAIFKRSWQFDNQFKNLLFAEHFYGKGKQAWDEIRKSIQANTPNEDISLDDDAGYCAINYAFIIDLTGLVRYRQTTELKEAKQSQSAQKRIARAADVRNEILEKLLGATADKLSDNSSDHPTLRVHPYQEIWANATAAEAFFGLNRFDLAIEYYKQYRKGIEAAWYKELAQLELAPEEADRRKKINVDWKLQTTAEQMTWLADIKSGFVQFGIEQDVDETAIREAAKRCLEVLFPDNIPAHSFSLEGKMGLALSGGGFRASLYHIGVLAKLAEADLLRHVEVLSCVSGGSIAGAYYYLLLKKRLERKDLPEMEQQDYLDLIRDMEVHFLEGVQKNLRARIFSNPFKNLRIFFDKTYTRSHRLAELYEEFLFSKALHSPAKKPIYIHKQRINPATYKPEQSTAGQDKIMDNTHPDFNPKTENWKRRNKVPMLVLNATTLNTGHNWQFTVSWMGEPPGNIRYDIDVKKRLRRMYYNQAPPPYKNNIRLGQAVGASSCVPVLFEPHLMPKLYPGIDLQLVDGGVHDNQGIASILEQECKLVIISDASGQMADTDDASKGSLSVFMRSDIIFQERIRESQIMDMKARERATQVKALGLVHLKQDLHQYPVNWHDSNEPTRRVLQPKMAAPDEDLTTYGILYQVQEALAAVRTDLDAFHDAESYALMYSGYKQMERELQSGKFDFLNTEKQQGPDAIQESFRFKEIRPFMEKPGDSHALVRLLKVSQSLLFKTFKLSWQTQLIGGILGLAAVAGLIWWAYIALWGQELTVGFNEVVYYVLTSLGIAVLAFLVGSWAEKAINWKSTLLKYGFMVIGSFLLALVSQISLWFLNPLYLKYGKLSQLRQQNKIHGLLQKIKNYL